MNKPIKCTYEREIKTDIRLALKNLISGFEKRPKITYETKAEYRSHGIGYTGKITRVELIKPRRKRSLWSGVERKEEKTKVVVMISLRGYRKEDGSETKYMTVNIYHEDYALGLDYYCSRLQTLANIWGAYKIEITENY